MRLSAVPFDGNPCILTVALLLEEMPQPDTAHIRPMLIAMADELPNRRHIRETPHVNESEALASFSLSQRAFRARPDRRQRLQRKHTRGSIKGC